MQKWLTILFVFICISSFSQELRGPSTLPAQSGENNGEEDQEQMSDEKKPIESKIEAWTLDQQFSSRKIQVLDTATINFHNYNPIFKQSISNTYTGHIGSAYESNLYFRRTKESNFLFLEPFDAYRMSQSEVKYYNTTTPYANLYYTQGSQGSNKSEQYFKAFFTQNIDSITNFGFEFDAIKAHGQYQLQEAKHRFMNVFASRNTERYNAYVSVIKGTDYVAENGGVTTDNLDRWIGSYNVAGYDINIRDVSANYPTAFSSAMENTTDTWSVLASGEYLMGKIPFFVEDSIFNDSVQPDFKAKYGVQYTVEFENNTRALYEKSTPSNYFENTYLASSGNTDSVFQTRFTHLLQVKAFEDTTKRFTFGKRVFVENEIVNAKHPLPGGQREYTYSNVYLGGEIYRTESVLGAWSASARFAMLGRNLGDAILKGTWDKNFVLGKDTTCLSVVGWYQDISANIFQDHWFSNHFKWENNFKKQHEVALKGHFSYPRFNTRIGLDYALLSNYLYNNTEALPDQYNGEFSVISAWINKDFVLGRFTWSNKAVWQELSNDAVLRLPSWSLYSSFYYSHYLFKVMKIQLGVEAYYNTEFYANRYEPSTTRFYLQDDYKVGGYPLITFFANAKLKRTSAFAMLYHANSRFEFGDFFASPSYPVDQMAFRFGFFWTFYD